MALSKEELEKEKDYLKEASSIISEKLDALGKEIDVKKEELTEFKKVLWQDKGNIDKVEMTTGLMNSVFEANFMLMKMDYYKKLVKLKYSPYFGRIDFKEDDKDELNKIYIGLAGVEKDLNYIIYDWRSAIAGMFYDYGIGRAKYDAPDGVIKGEIFLRRQYKIENNKILRAFDSSLNVVDDMLQEVLQENSSDKMKNIVNTIQKEQNEIIRNVHDKNLIVQGIAGSGKTSVALHRIAFLLYKIKNLKSSNVLIFSPNNVFSEYISDVLPELGENNTCETTFGDFAKGFIKEFRKVESFTAFIEKFYTKKDNDEKLTAYKLSDKMINVIENYVKEIENNIVIEYDIETKTNKIDKKYLNYILKERFNRLPIFSRVEKMAEHLCDKLGLSYGKYKRSFMKLIKEGLNIKPDYKKIYERMYESASFVNDYGSLEEIKLSKSAINYDDALCFIYLKGLLTGFPYSNVIRQVVIDEAQDYNKMQYIILSKIFKRASFTILGDVNQTINPYYKYDTLEKLSDVLNDKTRYIELNKTYRSSPNIINYANKVLNLKHVSAIRNNNNEPVTFRSDDQLLIKDALELKNKYKSVAVITKNEEEAKYVYDLLKDDVANISIMNDNSKEFDKNFVIVPSYLSKGLEFDSVISYTNKNNVYKKEEMYLFYVVVTRCQHELIIYNAPFTI